MSEGSFSRRIVFWRTLQNGKKQTEQLLATKVGVAEFDSKFLLEKLLNTGFLIFLDARGKSSADTNSRIK